MERQLLQEMELKLLQEQLEMLRPQVEIKQRLNFCAWQNTSKILDNIWKNLRDFVILFLLSKQILKTTIRMQKVQK
jgi:hypothetical protein